MISKVLDGQCSLLQMGTECMYNWNAGFCLAKNRGGGGQGRHSWTNGKPWRSKGVDAGGNVPPSHGKLKQHFMNFN